jgi:ATP-dependent DNA helicase RecG
MSQATDLLQKILQLEEHKGFQDTAVSGGLTAYIETWARQARAHDPLAEEMIEAIRGTLAPYSAQGRSSREVRLRRTQDLLGRLAAGERARPPDEPGAEAEPAKKRPARRPAPPVSPLTMATGSPVRTRPSVATASAAAAPAALSPAPAPISAEAARSAHRKAPSLENPILVVKGVRENTAKLFERLGVFTVRDLLYFFPRRYDDFSNLKPISTLTYGQVETVIGTVWRVEVKRSRNNLAMITATVVDDTGALNATWFGRDWMARSLVEGQQFVFSGKVAEFNGRLVMNGPEFEPYDTEELLHTGRLVPVYPLTEGLSKRVVRRIVKEAVDAYADLVEDALPEVIRERASLLRLPDALRQVHFPADWATLNRARRRLAFDEFFLIQLGMLQRKQQWQHDQPGFAFRVRPDILNSFRETLPFQLTGAQQRVLEEITADMERDLPMARLVQGDVGSGKTVVAATALLAAIADGAQGALMAPTEILAEQHYRGLSKLFKNFWLPVGDANPKLAEVAARLAAAKAEAEEAARQAQAAAAAAAATGDDAGADGTGKRKRKAAVDSRTYAANETIVDAPVELSPALAALKELLGKLDKSQNTGLQPLVESLEPPPGYRPLNIALLTGGMRKRERDKIYKDLAEGTCDLVIGTHALITEGLQYAKLGLVVIDEQHRFGVAQREKLRQKAAEIGVLADTLVMTATPIPRSLALTIYGDLDISIIDEMPPGRQVIKTRWIDNSRREQAYNFVRREVDAGRQAFIICPLVEESDKIEAKSAVAEHERLQTEIFPDYRLALLHGRMKAAEKEQIMAAFRRQEYDILVSTSVVEVGIDIPNATLMLVEGAERFGLSQLHQFRGRVGRGEHQSYCILVSDTALSTSMERLRVIEENHDGFHLAEEDMRLRGPGEFFGTRQSGAFDLRMARLSDMDTLQLARREAEYLFGEDPNLALPEHAPIRRQLEAFWELANSAPEA